MTSTDLIRQKLMESSVEDLKIVGLLKPVESAIAKYLNALDIYDDIALTTLGGDKYIDEGTIRRIMSKACKVQEGDFDDAVRQAIVFFFEKQILDKKIEKILTNASN